MSFTVYALTFVDGTTLVPAAFLNQINVNLSRAVDGLNGGTYTLASDLTFAGSTGDLIAESLDAVVKTGRTLQVESGGALLTDSGSTTTFNGVAYVYDDLFIQSGAELAVASGGLASVKSGATLEVKSGGVFEIENGGNGHVRAGGTFTVSGTGVDVGRLYIGDFADFIVQSGGEISAQAGSTVTLAGTNAINGTTTIGGDANVTTGVVLTIDAGAVLTVAGSINVSSVGEIVCVSGSAVSLFAGSQMYRACPLVLDGDGATTALRIDDTDQEAATFDPSTHDVWFVGQLTGNRIWAFTDPTAACAWEVVQDSTAYAFTLTIQANGGGTLATFAASTKTWARFVFDGADVRLLGTGTW